MDGYVLLDTTVNKQCNISVTNYTTFLDCCCSYNVLVQGKQHRAVDRRDKQMNVSQHMGESFQDYS